MNGKFLLTKKENLITQRALQSTIEDIEAVATDDELPFDPSARADMLQMLNAAKSALQKIQNATNYAVQLATYTPGDELQFFTKKS
jgi:hypothetical protein